MLGLSKPYFNFTAIKSVMTLVLRRKAIAKNHGDHNGNHNSQSISDNDNNIKNN